MFIPQVTPIQPINVIVQNSQGMSEWTRTLLSASVGAIFGIAGNLFMEYAKPAITKYRVKKLVSEQLAAEILQNMDVIDAANSMQNTEMLSIDDDKRTMMAGILLRQVNWDRFEYYFASEKALVYEIDSGKQLVSLHHLTSSVLKDSVQDKRHSSIRVLIAEAYKYALGYLTIHRLNYQMSDTDFDIKYEEQSGQENV